MPKINMGKPIKDPSKANKKMKYSDLLALQQAQATGGTTTAPVNATVGTTPNATTSATPGTPGVKNSLEGKAFNPDFRGYGDNR